MRQLTALDAQFLNVESPTTVGHVGSLIVLDPAPRRRWPGTSSPSAPCSSPGCTSPRRFGSAWSRCRWGSAVPTGSTTRTSTSSSTCASSRCPAPGTREQLGEQVARIHARPARPQPAAVGGLRHHRPRGRPAGVLLQDPPRGHRRGLGRRDPRDDHGPHRRAAGRAAGGRALRAAADAVDRSTWSSRRPAAGGQPRRAAGAPCRARSSTSTSCPAPATSPGVRLVSERRGDSVGRVLGEPAPARARRTASCKAPRTPLNGTITAHRRFAFGSLPLGDVKPVKNHFGMTVNDVVMALTRHGAAPLAARPRRAARRRRWSAAVPVSIRAEDQRGANGNQVSVMLAELPTHLADPEERLVACGASMLEAKRAFDAVPASLLQDLSHADPDRAVRPGGAGAVPAGDGAGRCCSTCSSATCRDRSCRCTSPARGSRASTRSRRSPTSPAGSTSRCSPTTARSTSG